MTRLEIRIDDHRVHFAGRIDDAAQLATLAAKLPAGPIVLDTDGVTFINSIGMREWIRFVRAAREGGRQITLDRVADVLMTQMNMINELHGLTVTSFHAQYACASCGFEAQPLIDAVANQQALQMLAPPRPPCPECGAAMELADFPERYLSIFRT
jgi:anti-anti-sigma regulatory factor